MLPGRLSPMTTHKAMTRVQLEAMGEVFAVDNLTRMGLRGLHCNWRCRYGECDVIASETAHRTVVSRLRSIAATVMEGSRRSAPEQKVRWLRWLAGLWPANQDEF